jgi:hypothetical protein
VGHQVGIHQQKEGKEMKKIERKVLCFLTALFDVYRDEENRELATFSKLDIGDDFTEDFTALLLAVSVLCEQLTGYDGDLIDLIHMLNKLAIQHIMDKKNTVHEECDFDYEAEDE